MRTLFPIIDTPQSSPAGGLPLFRDIAWDFAQDMPRYDAEGEPEQAEGLEALKGWALNAVRTERYRWEIYDSDYGCELGRLIGQRYSEDTKLAEAVRYVREALAVNPYIKAVQVHNAAFDGSTLHMDITMETLYGEASIHV